MGSGAASLIAPNGRACKYRQDWDSTYGEWHWGECSSDTVPSVNPDETMPRWFLAKATPCNPTIGILFSTGLQVRSYVCESQMSNIPDGPSLKKSLA